MHISVLAMPEPDDTATLVRQIQETGFADQSHLTRHFRRYRSQTPMLYRSLHAAQRQSEAQRRGSAAERSARASGLNRAETDAAEGINFRALLDANADVVALIGYDWTLYYVSASCRRVLGWEPREAQGRNVAEFVLDDDLPLARTYCLERVEGERGFVCVRARKRDGTVAHLESNARVLDEESPIEGANVLLTMRDVSDRMEREDTGERKEREKKPKRQG
jgi:PAS domain S-box-containing protein